MASDFQLEDTIYLPFTTRAYATGIPTVLAGTPKIDIYEDAGTTQVVVDETLVVDFDGVVGFNMITVTATAGTGFELGKTYTAIIEAGTVDSVSVIGEVVGHFTLDMSAAAKDLANATDGLGALETIASDTEALVVLVQTDAAAILVDTSSTLDSAVSVVDAKVVIVDQDTSDLKVFAEATASEVSQILSDTTAIHLETTVIKSEVSDILIDTAALELSIDAVESEVSQILSDTTRLELGLIVVTGALEGTPTTTVLQTDLAEASDDHYNDMVLTMTSGNETGESRHITDYTGSTGTITVDPALSGSPSSTETFAIIAGVETGGALSAAQDSSITAIESDIVLMLSDVSSVLSDTTIIASDIKLVESNVSSILSDTTIIASDVVVIDANLTTVDNLLDTEMPAVTSNLLIIASDTLAIEVDTSTTLENRQVTIASDLLLALSDVSSILSDTTIIASDIKLVESSVSNILSDTAIIESQTTVIESDSIIVESSIQVVESDGILAQSSISNILSDTTHIEIDVTRIELGLIVITGVLEGTPSTTVLPTDATEATNDQYKDMIFMLTDNTGAGQSRRVTSYSGATGEFTVDPAFVGGTPAVGDTFAVINSVEGAGALTTKQDSDLTHVASDMILISSDISSILSDTTIIASDVVLIDADTSDLKSTLLLVKSEVSDISSDTLIIASDLKLVESSVSNILSDTLVLESSVSQILSDTTRLELTTIAATGLLEGTPTASDMTTDLAETTDNHYNNMTVMMTTGDEAGQSRQIADYTGATGNIEVTPNWTAAPAATETFVILPTIESGGSLSAAQDSRLTRVQSDAILIYSDTTIIASDTLVIESDTKRLELTHIIATGTVEASGSNSSTQVQTDLSETTNDHYNNNVTILFTSDTEAGQARVIDDYVGATGIVSWTEALTAKPPDNSTFTLLPSSSVIATLATGAITAATFAAGAIDASAIATDGAEEIADKVWDEAASGHVTAGTFGVQCGTDIDSILSDSTIIASDLLLVASDASSVLSDTTIIASDLLLVASDVSSTLSDTTIIASDVVVLDTNLTTVDDFLDTEMSDTLSRVTLVQAQLPTTLSAGRIRADMEAVNASTTAAVAIALSGAQIIVGTVDNDEAPTTTTFEADDITEATADHFNGRIVIFTTGILVGQATDITDYALNGSNGKFTVTALTEAPGNDDTFVIL